MDVISSLTEVLPMSFVMFWKILWPLILGFGLYGVIQAMVSKKEMGAIAAG